MGKVGDYYLDKKNYNLYGPKSKKGWGTSIQLKGADGNANVTRYVFTSGYDFTANNRFYSVIMEGGRNALMNSAWLTYLVREHHGTANVLYYYQIPGMAASNTIYSVSYYNSDYVSQNVYVNIVKENGVGDNYKQIVVVRIRAIDTISNNVVGSDSRNVVDNNFIIPDELDVSNYEEVADYYGFGNGN